MVEHLASFQGVIGEQTNLIDRAVVLKNENDTLNYEAYLKRRLTLRLSLS
jgi:hypothetical protein